MPNPPRGGLRPPASRTGRVATIRPAVDSLLAVLGCIALLCVTPASAQSRWRDVAVPYQSPPAFVQGADRHAFMPRADAFERSAADLADNWQRHCERPDDAATLAALKARWRGALIDWAGLVAVPVGPLIERRSGRRIDFHPTRRHLIERAITAWSEAGLSVPGSSAREDAMMDRVGSAASGLPAMEWLLWRREPGADARLEQAACRFGARLARDVQVEAAAIAAGMHRRSVDVEAEPDDRAIVEASSEIVNQTLAGLEQLRLQHIERPLGQAQSRGAPLELPRSASGTDAAERAARWSALRQILVFDGETALPAGAGVVSIETYLRGRGLNPLSDRLHAAAVEVDQRLHRAEHDDPDALAAAAASLAAVKRLLEAQAAPAMDIRIGFSDADGD